MPEQEITELETAVEVPKKQSVANLLGIDYNDIMIPADENELEVMDNCFDRYLLYIKPRLDVVLAMRRRGLSNKQVAHNLGISVSYLHTCMLKYTELYEIMQKGRLDAIAEVENAAFKSAVGFTQPRKGSKLTKDGEVKEVTDELYFPPNPDMIKFILTNRSSEDWKNKISTDLSGSIDHNFKDIFNKVTQSEVAERQKELKPPR